MRERSIRDDAIKDAIRRGLARCNVYTSDIDWMTEAVYREVRHEVDEAIIDVLVLEAEMRRAIKKRGDSIEAAEAQPEEF